MSGKRRNQGPHRPQPLNQARLAELALAYVARFATTQGKLRSYLQRKLRERGWDEEGSPPPVEAIEVILAHHVEAGYVDDEAWARMKTGSLMRRGYGARRVGEALGMAGVDEDTRRDLRPAEAEQRRAALVLARRRRFGPFAVQPPDRPMREKHVAAMLRAGHSLDIARRIVDAKDPDAAEQWVESAIGDD